MTNWTDKAISFDDCNRKQRTSKHGWKTVSDRDAKSVYAIEDHKVAPLVNSLIRGNLTVDEIAARIEKFGPDGDGTWGKYAERVKGIDAVSDWIQTRLNSPSWQAAFPNACRDLAGDSPVEVRAHSGHSASAIGRYINLSYIKTGGAYEYVIRHELVHCIVAREMIAAGLQVDADGRSIDRQYAAHGPEFVGTLIKTIELDYGTEAAALAADYFLTSDYKEGQAMYAVAFTDGTYPTSSQQAEVAPPLAAKPATQTATAETSSTEQLQLDI